MKLLDIPVALALLPTLLVPTILKGLAYGLLGCRDLSLTYVSLAF